MIESSKPRRGWLQMACHDVELREQLRLMPMAMIGVSALDVLDGLVNIIDAQEKIIDEKQRIIDGKRP